jgi:hypothetical protein
MTSWFACQVKKGVSQQRGKTQIFASKAYHNYIIVYITYFYNKNGLIFLIFNDNESNVNEKNYFQPIELIETAFRELT